MLLLPVQRLVWRAPVRLGPRPQLRIPFQVRAFAASRWACEQRKPHQAISTDIYTVPNMLTMTRIAATPVIGFCVATGRSTAAVSLFLYLCATDFVDGTLARRYNMRSVLGLILDPAADKFLMTVCTVALVATSSMPMYVGAVIVGRDVMLSGMAFWLRFRALPAPKTAARFFDMSIVTHTANPNTLGKVNTALQMAYIGGLVLQPALDLLLAAGTLPFFDCLGVLVAATTLASGASYALRRGATAVPQSPP